MSNSFIRLGYIPTIWTMSGTRRPDMVHDILDDQDLTAWLIVGLDPQNDSKEKREATWVVLRAETRKAAMNRAIENFGYSLVFAVERKEQPKSEEDIFEGRRKDANNNFWNLFRNIDRLAMAGHNDDFIINMIERYNPADRTHGILAGNRFVKEKEDKMYAKASRVR